MPQPARRDEDGVYLPRSLACIIHDPAAEKEAVDRGCRHAYVETFGSQALDFYKKLGYEVFGALDDFPRGEARFFLQKRDLGARTRTPPEGGEHFLHGP